MRMLAVLAALIVPLAVYAPVYQEHQKAIERADAQISEMNTKIEQARTAQHKLPQFHEEVQKLDIEVEKLRRILPPGPALDDLRELVDTAASQAGVHIDVFRAKCTHRGENTAVEVDAAAAGKLADLTSFFDSLANRRRIIDVSFVTLQKQPDDRWRAKFLMTTYALP
jgi:Tfp pilus assembly protein PilO